MLNKLEIKELIASHGMISGFIDVETQLTPNGFDLTVEKVFSFSAGGTLDFSNKERCIPATGEVAAVKKNAGDPYGWWTLPRGAYKVRTNETVSLPNNLTALAFTRTSLLRMGAFTQHGVWDAGFRGKGEFILVVPNPEGISMKQNARIAQLVFFPVEETESYAGIYKDL